MRRRILELAALALGVALLAIPASPLTPAGDPEPAAGGTPPPPGAATPAAPPVPDPAAPARVESRRGLPLIAQGEGLLNLTRISAEPASYWSAVSPDGSFLVYVVRTEDDIERSSATW